MRTPAFVAALLLAAGLTSAQAADGNPTPEQQALIEKYRQMLQSLHPQRGDVAIRSADATLHLGSRYYFLPAEDAKQVLVDGWGNSKEATSDVLGMVFPDGKTFVDDTWAAVITFTADGYVSDADAKTINYDDILKSGQSHEDEINQARKSENLAPLHVVGWAQPPSYDQAYHALVWARDIHFGNQTDDSLNYDLRTLGRRGILSMNIVSAMSKLAEVRMAAGELQQVAGFNPGAGYADYREGTDKKAEYGLAGLVAAGIGVAAAQKLGLVAIAVLFFKKAAILLIAAFGGLGAWLRRMFRKDRSLAPTDLRSK